MSPEHYITLASSVVFLGLAGLAARHSLRNSMAMPLSLLCATLFSYNLLEVLGALDDSLVWQWLEAAAAAMAAPFLFHLTLAFLGTRRRYRFFMWAIYVHFGALAFASILPSWVPSMAHFPGSDTWALVMLVGLLPALVPSVYWLARHARDAGESEERAHAQLFLAALLFGPGGSMTDLVQIAGASTAPRLGAVSLLISAILLTGLVLRARILGGRKAMLVARGLIIGLVGVGINLFIFGTLGLVPAALVLGSFVVALVALFAFRTSRSLLESERERAAEWSTLGKLSSQMAHDILNPIAAIRGAAQFLEEERRQGRSIDGQSALIDLIVEQTGRVEKVVGEYKRLGQVLPVWALTPLGPLLEGVASRAQITQECREKRVTIGTQIQFSADTMADPDLLTVALENLVRNAIQAMPLPNSEVSVDEAEAPSIELSISGTEVSDKPGIEIRVKDTGPGMDARVLEQSMEPFFTTRHSGSGLGLSFARRVARAHGGSLAIRSVLGQGTEVLFSFPLRSPSPEEG